MKKALLVMALSGTLIPAHAWAALNYNETDIGYSTTNYGNGDPGLVQFNLGYAKSVSSTTYLDASYGSGTQHGLSIAGDKKMKSISLGAGYHTPLEDTPTSKVDAIIKGNIVAGSAKLAGSSLSANSYDFGTGVRAQFGHGLESSLAVVHARRSNGTYTNTDTFFNAQIGFNFTPKIQMAFGVDLFGHDPVMNVGLRFFH